MIRYLANYFGGVKPVFIDGLLYALIAWLVFSQGFLGGDEAAKFISPAAKFWINYAIGSMAAAVGAIKMFRSTAYSDHQQQKLQTNTGP